jgi:uracil-DNA glycosylase
MERPRGAEGSGSSAVPAARDEPLERLVADLRAEQGGRDVPGFDPLDGGTEARLLLLLETPGPRIARTGGIVSRDNPTGTGRNLRHFLAGAGLARADTVIWNAVPWVIHAPGARNRAPRAAEVRAGLQALPRLLDLLPHLRVAVLAGRVAGQARGVLAAARPGLRVLAMPHPSPTIVCTSPEVPARIAAALAAARKVLEEGGGGAGSREVAQGLVGASLDRYPGFQPRQARSMAAGRSRPNREAST